ncbi:hypothetical protein D3C73_544330 [compost metagenome]
MEIDADADMRSDGLSDNGDRLDSLLNLFIGINDLHFLAAVELDGLDPAGNHVLCIAGNLRRAVAADPGIDFDPIPDLATEKRMDRLAQRLALDVPERLVDAGERRHVNGPSAIEPAAIKNSPVILDQKRVLADQVIGHLMHGGLDGQRPALNHRLTPTDDAFVGLDLQKQPARRDDVGGKLGDLHQSAPNMKSCGCIADYSADHGVPFAPETVGTRRSNPLQTRIKIHRMDVNINMIYFWI